MKFPGRTFGKNGLLMPILGQGKELQEAVTEIEAGAAAAGSSLHPVSGAKLLFNTLLGSFAAVSSLQFIKYYFQETQKLYF